MLQYCADQISQNPLTAALLAGGIGAALQKWIGILNPVMSFILSLFSDKSATVRKELDDFLKALRDLLSDIKKPQ